ncbi:Sodium/hydrogen exchanger family-domain-containing protein [Roridomyces roridus]|uniref:Sodium/hydrogen exchanger family-domain-containing protein n=1 Tax=Roridomyces roridus TaxID=1738132 RepID=A0AAD7CGF9_9AGAR|nr:Sodium/hydrogen exchanger family-domain-containing protein [Roridomyces roridus]
MHSRRLSIPVLPSMTLSHELLEVTPSGLAYICLGGFVVAFSSISLLIKEKLYINEVLLGTIFGVVVGPFCANIFDPRSWGDRTDEITLEVMRFILATGLFAIGVELPGSYMKKHAKGLLVLVVPTMAIGWVVVAAFIHLLFPNLVSYSHRPYHLCHHRGKYALKHVPHNLRLLISAESAANDGLAYPFLSISIYLTVEASRRVAIGKWFLVGWLYQVILGIVLGAIMGLAFSYLMKMSHRRGYIDRESFIAQYLALALFTIGVASTIGSDDLLAAFACGNAISWDQNFNEVTEDAVFSSVIDLVLNCGCFVYIGGWMPFDAFNTPELGITPWRLVVLFIIILALRRIPSVLLLYRWVPEIKTWQEALFTGHFGPMGVGAVFVSTLARTRLPHPSNPPANQQELLAATLQPLVAFVVLGSIIVHGLSIPFFSLSGTMRSRTRSLLVTLTSTDPSEWLVGLRRGPVVVFGSKDMPNDAPALRQNNAERGEAGPAVRIVTPETSSPKEMNVDVDIDPGVDAEMRETTVDEEPGRRPVVEVAMDGVRGDVEEAQ